MRHTRFGSGFGRGRHGSTSVLGMLVVGANKNNVYI